MNPLIIFLVIFPLYCVLNKPVTTMVIVQGLVFFAAVYAGIAAWCVRVYSADRDRALLYTFVYITMACVWVGLIVYQRG